MNLPGRLQMQLFQFLIGAMRLGEDITHTIKKAQFQFLIGAMRR